MLKQLIIGSACTVLLLSSAVAIPADAAVTRANAAPMATTAKTGSHSVARHHHHRLAMSASTRGDKEVNALNALESAGYRQFDNLHAQHGNFVATATKAGKSYQVTITPSGSIGANNA